MCMAELFRRSGFPFAVAHCNFRLRAQESDGDEALVRRWCSEAGVECHVAAFDTKEHARENGVSIEMAARDLRYRFFAEVCDEFGYQAVAVAHNANDNAETLILNLLRGTGLSGICGMDLLGDTPCEEFSYLPLFRPLLSFTREEILAFNKENSVPSREDSTNADTSIKRNNIRHGVFPLFKEINPSFLEVLGRDMDHFRQAAAALDRLYDVLLRQISNEPAEDMLKVDIDLLMDSPWKDYLLYRLMSSHGFNAAQTESLKALLERKDGTLSGKRFLSENFVLATGSSHLFFYPLEAEEEDREVIITGPGSYSLGRDSFSVSEAPVEPGMDFRTPGVTYIDSQALQYPFVVRRPREGDWLVPFGMRGGRKKLSNLFVDLKFSLADKSRALVIAPAGDDSRIAALAGVRIDDCYKVTGDSTSVLIIDTGNR